MTSTREPVPRLLYIYGAGGQGRETAWYARACWGPDLQICFLVSRPEFLPPERSVAGADVRLIEEVAPDPDDRVVVAVGDPSLRRRTVDQITAIGLIPTSVIHPTVDTSAASTIGIGTIIGPGAVVSVDCVVGQHAQLNIGSTISHDVVVGDFATLAPGVNVAGWVEVSAGCFLGVGATVANGEPGRRLILGADSVIAAGACVLKDVPAGSMVAGVPAVRKR